MEMRCSWQNARAAVWGRCRRLAAIQQGRTLKLRQALCHCHMYVCEEERAAHILKGAQWAHTARASSSAACMGCPCCCCCVLHTPDGLRHRQQLEDLLQTGQARRILETIVIRSHQRASASGPPAPSPALCTHHCRSIAFQLLFYYAGTVPALYKYHMFVE